MVKQPEIRTDYVEDIVYEMDDFDCDCALQLRLQLTNKSLM